MKDTLTASLFPTERPAVPPRYQCFPADMWNWLRLRKYKRGYIMEQYRPRYWRVTRRFTEAAQ